MPNKTPSSRAPLTIVYMLLSELFVACLIVSNLIEIKTVDLGWFTITAGVTVFPISYIINDCVVEVYGFRKARLMIWLGFAMSLFVAIMLNVAIALPGGADWHGQEAREHMSRMKAKAAAAGDAAAGFPLRAIASTLFGEGMDSVVFFPIAFAGVLPWDTIFSLIATQTLLKTVYEIIILPVTVKVVSRMKQAEGIDTVDTGVDYRWWRVADI